MHLLKTRPGGYSAEEGIAHLEQTPGELVILSAADTEIALLADACDGLPSSFPRVRLANLLHFRQPASIDLYVDEVLRHAKLIVVSLLGGVSYWHYLVQRLVELQKSGTALILTPGDDAPDPELARLSAAKPGACERVWRYLREGGAENARGMLDYLHAEWLNGGGTWPEPVPLPKAAVYHRDSPLTGLAAWRGAWRADAPVAMVLFYRAHLQSGNTGVFDRLASRLLEAGLNPLPVAVSSLKLPLCLEVVEDLASQHNAAVILNTTGFSMSTIGQPAERPFAADVPVLQVILSGGNEEDWRKTTQGLSPRDIAMNVALPEVDGRIVTRAVSFKGLVRRSDRVEADVVAYRAVDERVVFCARLAAAWVKLRQTPNEHKRVALVLANYPTREGRIGNGVGLDTPASVVAILEALDSVGYCVAGAPPPASPHRTGSGNGHNALAAGAGRAGHRTSLGVA